MDPQTMGQKTKAPSMAEYASELLRNGTRILPGADGTFWAGYESRAMVRMPTFHLAPPAPHELRQVLWRGRVAVMSYLLKPDEQHPANAWLYVCRDPSYSLDKLSKPARRDARRAQRSLRIAPLDWPTLLRHGWVAFSETRARVGLSDGTPGRFQRRFNPYSRNPFHHVIGAWKDDILVAFMTLVVVNDWAEIGGCFSTDAHRGLCPNNGLAHYALEYFLVQRGLRIVSYGLSSIQEESDVAGLHAYKKKVGFEAQRVHRVFVLHPLLRPFANRLTLWGMNTALRFMPGERRLKKARGMLACVLGEKRMLGVAEKNTSDE